MAEYNLGRVAFFDKGAYSQEETYNKWDFVTTVDSTYLFIGTTPQIGKTVTDTNFWMCIADGKPATLAAAAADLAKEAANSAATLANEKAALAQSAAALANTKAGLADAAAILATDKAVLAQSASTLANDKAALAQTAADNADEKAAEVTAAVLSAGQLGSIKPTDSAPTPARNGNYTFSVGGNKPAWLTAEAGVTTVKAGDGVAVVYAAPSSYSYTHVDVNSYFKDRVEIANKSFLESTEPSFTNDELAVIKAIKGIKIYNANPARKYLIRFLCNNDSTFKYNICITDKLTGVEQTKQIASVTTPGGLNFLTLSVVFGTDSPVTIKLAVDYSGLSNRVYMNTGYAGSNLVLSKQTYSDVKIEDLDALVTKATEIADIEISNGISKGLLKSALELSDVVADTQIQINNTYAGYSIEASVGWIVNSGSPYALREYPVVAGTLYILKGENVALTGALPIASFRTTSGVGKASTIILKAILGTNDYSVVYRPLTDGYVFVSYLTTNVDELKLYSSKIEDRYVLTPSEYMELKYPMYGKSMAILGDSIMMLTKSIPTGTNTVTFVGSDTNTYTIGQLTNIGGRLYVTTTLVGGQPGAGTIECEITNSQQTNLDSQNWDALKSKLGLSELINCGLGGATIYERNYVTAYPYPDGDGNTTCISNQARMLKRLVNNGRTAPDMIMIWAGTNGAGQPATDNYDAIMALDWATLSDNVLGLTYRRTFYGGLRFTLEYLYRNFKYATIYVYSPIQTNPVDYRTYAALTTTRNALEKMAKRYACIFCDALNESGIVDFYEKQDGSGYWLADGLHPNSAGKILMKNYAHRKITSSYFDKKDV